MIANTLLYDVPIGGQLRACHTSSGMCAIRPVCPCAYTDRAYRPCMRIQTAHTGRIHRPVCSCAHTGRVCPYRLRIQAAYTGRCARAHIPAAYAHTGRTDQPRTPAGAHIRAFRPRTRRPPPYTGRCAHARPPAGVPMRAYQSGIRGHSGRCAHGAYASRLHLY